MNGFIISFFFASGVALLVAYLTWMRRKHSGGQMLALLMLFAASWAFCNGMEAISPAMESKIFWSKLEYIGTYNAVPLYFLLAMSFSHREKWITRFNILLLWVIPLLTIILAASNEWHHLIWTAFSWHGDLLIYHHGPWFWIGIGYSYLMLLISTILLITNTIRMPRIYRRQNWFLILAALIPWIANIIYLLEIEILKGRNFTSISFIFTGSTCQISLVYSFIVQSLENDPILAVL